MKIILSPQRRDDTLTLVKSGDTLTINNISYDFSLIPEGATLPADATDCEWIVGDISKVDGEIELTILTPHGPDPTQEQAFPEPLLDVQDGVII
jgi:hypothetical protein